VQESTALNLGFTNRRKSKVVAGIKGKSGLSSRGRRSKRNARKRLTEKGGKTSPAIQSLLGLGAGKRRGARGEGRRVRDTIKEDILGAWNTSLVGMNTSNRVPNYELDKGEGKRKPESI